MKREHGGCSLVAVVKIRRMSPALDLVMQSTRRLVITDHLRGSEPTGEVHGYCNYVPDQFGRHNYVQLLRYLRHGLDGEQPEKHAVLTSALEPGVHLVLSADPHVHASDFDEHTRMIIRRVKCASGVQIEPDETGAGAPAPRAVQPAPSLVSAAGAGAAAPVVTTDAMAKTSLFSGFENNPAIVDGCITEGGDAAFPFSGVQVYKLADALDSAVMIAESPKEMRVVDSTSGASGVIAMHLATIYGTVYCVRPAQSTLDAIVHNVARVRPGTPNIVCLLSTERLPETAIIRVLHPMSIAEVAAAVQDVRAETAQVAALCFHISSQASLLQQAGEMVATSAGVGLYSQEPVEMGRITALIVVPRTEQPAKVARVD